MATRIVIVDDHGVLREGLKLIISQQSSMEIVAEATNGRDAVDLVRTHRPDLVLMDISMPDLNGIDATAQIKSMAPEVKILALSAYSDKRFVADMLKAGVNGYILKDVVSEQLITAINKVMKGQFYLCQKTTGVVIQDYVKQVPPCSGSSRIDTLTSRERELMQLLAEGKSSKEAARILHLSIKTIDARRREIMKKLEVNSAADLTKLAIKEGITTLEF